VTHNGDLTEAQKLLLQKFPDLPEDDPLIELAAWNASLEQKVDNFGESLNIWTQAILKQTELATQQNQLIVSQNLTLQSTGKTNNALGQILTALQQDFSSLQMEFQWLKDTIEAHGMTLKSLSGQSQSLSQKLDNLSLNLKSLEILSTLSSNIEILTKSVNSLHEKLNFNLGGLLFLGVLIVVFQFMQLFFYKDMFESLNQAIQGVRDRAEWALIKLERLEKR